MNDWTNAIKAGVSLAVMTLIDLILAIAVIAGVQLDPEQWAALGLAVNAFVGAVLGLWVIFTHTRSPIRVSDDVRRADPLLASRATEGAAGRLSPPPIS